MVALAPTGRRSPARLLIILPVLNCSYLQLLRPHLEGRAVSEVPTQASGEMNITEDSRRTILYAKSEWTSIQSSIQNRHFLPFQNPKSKSKLFTLRTYPRTYDKGIVYGLVRFAFAISG